MTNDANAHSGKCAAGGLRTPSAASRGSAADAAGRDVALASAGVTGGGPPYATVAGIHPERGGFRPLRPAAVESTCVRRRSQRSAALAGPPTGWRAGVRAHDV